MNSEQPLRIEVTDGRLVISLGVNTLAYSQKVYWEYTGNECAHFEIVDNEQFAKDVAHELEREEENGDTVFTLALDKAAENAINMGSTAVKG